MNGQIEEPASFEEMRDAGEDPRPAEAPRDWRDMVLDAEDWSRSARRSEYLTRSLLFIQAAAADLVDAENEVKDLIAKEGRAKLAARAVEYAAL